MLWRDVLSPYSDGDDALFGPAVADSWGDTAWEPCAADEMAATKFRVQLISRVTTQRLGYLDGVEATALTSVHKLFNLAREICTEHVTAGHFATLTWHVLNSHVRPFTAKWHPVSASGQLTALDMTDDFRVDLESVQRKLRRLDELLATQFSRGWPIRSDDCDGARAAVVAQEFELPLPWGIPYTQGGVSREDADKLNAAEREAIRARRRYYQLDENKPHAVGLALSGGGIRSATFSVGVLVALARRGVLPQVDYLSTVSGGGYIGSFLTSLLNSPSPAAEAPVFGLRPNEQPFERSAGEGAAIRHLRHSSKYLASGPLFERLEMACAQAFGMVLNGFAVVLIVASAALLVNYLHTLRALEGWWPWVFPVIWCLLLGWALIALVLIRLSRGAQRVADRAMAALVVTLAIALAGRGLALCHDWVAGWREWPLWMKASVTLAGVIPLVSSTLAAIGGKALGRMKITLTILSAVAVPLFLIAAYLVAYELQSQAAWPLTSIAVAVATTVIFAVLLDINRTSPHRHYRRKLVEAYLLRLGRQSSPNRAFESFTSLKLSEATSQRAPCHLINAALNVPGSKNPCMQGRLTDFFLFSHAFCGSPLTGYQPTADWESCDRHLDLGTAMAISGAAAAPQMGLGTRRRLSFWLALLNVRLGYWLANPAKRRRWFGAAPGLWHLLQEMFGFMNERRRWLYVSDGGHIENLGVYELLRRRCKFIVAVDGEQDQRMTFAAITTLQRLASIDLGVKIDVKLDDLRLNSDGLSRSHFRFCRIEYPGGQYGYLLYVKLSLTGNEGEFLRRYRLDEPVFPHHSTADQFFTETQFEAYRSLGEHIGDKLFLRTFVGDDLARSDSLRVETWFLELAKRTLNPVGR